jgi:hypothetical protein
MILRAILLAGAIMLAWSSPANSRPHPAGMAAGCGITMPCDFRNPEIRKPKIKKRHVKRSKARQHVRKAVPVKACTGTPERLAALRSFAAARLEPDRARWLAFINEAEPAEPSPLNVSFALELFEARQYLVRTSLAGATMTRQGPELAIERLHPVFAIRLARAIRQARASGLPNAGVYSAYRPPIFGIGGFRDKSMSMHAYGLAVDMKGIGRPGSKDAAKWYRIAGAHRIYNPYGPNHRAEWNHYQPTFSTAVTRRMELRQTITAKGPKDLTRMWRVAERIISDRVIDSLPTARPRYARHRYAYARHVRKPKTFRLAAR